MTEIRTNPTVGLATTNISTIYTTISASGCEINGDESTVIEKAIQALILAVIMLGGFIFNASTIITIVRVDGLRLVPHNLLVLNLAIADISMVFASMLFSLISVVDGGQLLECHQILCKVSGFFGTMCAFTNLPLILSIAIDRLLLVVFPQRFPPNRVRVFVMVVLSWLGGVTVGAVNAVDWQGVDKIGFHYNNATKRCSPSWKNEPFRISILALNFGVIFPAFVLCYLIITSYLWKKNRRLSNHSNVKKPSNANVQLCAVRTAGEEDKFDGENWIFRSHFSVHSTRMDFQPYYDSEDEVETDMASHLKSTRVRRGNRRRTHMRVARMGMLLVINTSICWTPYVVFHLEPKNVPELRTEWYGVLSTWLTYCVTLLDPVVYAFMNQRLKREISKTWRIGCRKSKKRKA